MKKIMLFILLFIPFIVNAEECNRELHKEYLSLTKDITYDNQFVKSQNSFTITIYNVLDGIHAEYNEKKYYPTKDNTIVISGIECGEKVNIEMYGNDGCNALKSIVTKEPYHNKYYGSEMCKGYEETLLMCKYQFTNIEVTKSLLEKSIYNYNHTISQKTTKDVVVEEETILSKVTNFLTNWGIKILLAVISTILSVSIFSDKYRKVKHGI